MEYLKKKVYTYSYVFCRWYYYKTRVKQKNKTPSFVPGGSEACCDILK